MKIRSSAYGAYHHQYHVVWIPKYRKKAVGFRILIWVLHFKCHWRKPVGIYSKSNLARLRHGCQSYLAELWAIDLEDNGALAVKEMVVPYVSSRNGIAS